MATILNENDILFAHKALNLMPGLTDAARRVAGAIIDHFNRRTGQCDPGIERLADLTGLSRATVIRATEKLDALGLIAKDSHGGHAHRAAYLPTWEVFRGGVEAWDEKMRGGRVKASAKVSQDGMRGAGADETKVASVRRSRSQGCDVKGRTDATQTNRSNQSNKPIEGEQVETRGEKPPRGSEQDGRRGLRNGGSERIGQSSLFLPIAGGKPVKSVSHGRAARAAADRRLGTAVNALDEQAIVQVLDWFTPSRHEEAVSAELARRGGGLAYIRESMGEERLAAYG